MTLEIPEKIEGDETTLHDLLSKTHKEELKEILALGVKYRREGEEMKGKFWNEHKRDEFVNLIGGFDESICKFVKGLESEEKRVLDRLNEIEKKKFINEFLNDRILYSGDFEKKHEYNVKCPPDLQSIEKWIKEVKYDIKPGTYLDLDGYGIGDEGVAILANERKECLQPGMEINFYKNDIGVEGIRILAKERKEKLQPGMKIRFFWNEIGDEGVAILAKERKDSLQPGMDIDLGWNNISDKGLEILAKERKDKLKPGMTIGLYNNEKIGDEGIEILAKEWKECLQPGISIDLGYTKITDVGVEILFNEWKNSIQPGMELGFKNNENIGDGFVDAAMSLVLKGGVKFHLWDVKISLKKMKELKNWVKGYKKQGIDCELEIREEAYR